MNYNFGVEYDYFKNPVPDGGANPTTTPPEPVVRAPSTPDATPTEPVPSSTVTGGEQPAPSLTDQVTTLLSGAGTVDFNLKAGLVLAATALLLVAGLMWLIKR